MWSRRQARRASLLAIAAISFAVVGTLATGADRQHWAFRRLARPGVPTVKRPELVRTPIDAFILSSLARKGLSIGPLADRATLLRRLTFDLTGLPPRPAEIEQFLADSASDAYARAVERLLASPHYGE